jgi:hypothetical protein
MPGENARCFHRRKHQCFHEHRMIGVGADVATLVGPHCIDFVNFIFSESNSPKVGHAKDEPDRNQCH